MAQEKTFAQIESRYFWLLAALGALVVGAGLYPSSPA